jgi:hypothetical protein
LTKEEFEAYQKVFHKEYDHNAMVDGIFEEFADEINAKIDGRTREIAKKLIRLGDSDEKIAAVTELPLEDIVVLRSQLEA